MTHCHPGHGFHHGFHPFFADAMHFDPMYRFGPPGGRGPGHGCRKFKAQCAARTFTKEILVDMTETDDHVQILADVPGVTKDAIRIEVDKGVLTINVVAADDAHAQSPDASAPPHPANEFEAIPADASDPCPADGSPAGDAPEDGNSAEAPDEAGSAHAEAQKPRVLLQQRPKQFARRSVALPEGTDASRAEAACSDGVLTITIPKQALPETKKRVPIA